MLCYAVWTTLFGSDEEETEYYEEERRKVAEMVARHQQR